MAFEMKILPGASKKFYAFNSKAFSGTRLQAASELYPDGYATKKAGKVLCDNPELLAGHWLLEYVSYEDGSGTRTSRMATNGAEVLAKIDKGIHFMLPEEAADEKPIISLYCGWIKGSGRVLDVVSQIARSEKYLFRYYDMRRENDENKAVYVSSYAFDVHDIFFSINSVYDLSKMNALSLGSGTGTDSFLGSEFFNSCTGAEIYPPLFRWSLKNRDTLLAKDLIKDNVHFMLKDILSEDFDMSQYDFVYSYKPFFADVTRMVPNLLKLAPGALFLSNLMPEMAEDPAFTANFYEIEVPISLQRVTTVKLYKRV